MFWKGAEMSHNSFDRNRDELKTIVACIEDAVDDLDEWSVDNDDEFGDEVFKIKEILEDMK